MTSVRVCPGIHTLGIHIPVFLMNPCSGSFHSPPTAMCTGPCVPPLRQLFILERVVDSKQDSYPSQLTTLVAICGGTVGWVGVCWGGVFVNTTMV